MSKLIDIEGIGEVYAEKLGGAGVGSIEALLETGATPSGRKALVDKTGIAAALILKWVNHADLFRVKGVAGEYAELLEAAGVDTVPELAQRNVQNLYDKLVATNEQKNLVRALPRMDQVQDWVDQAKALPRAVHY